MKSIFALLGEQHELVNININFKRELKWNSKSNKKQSNRRSVQHSPKTKRPL